MKFAVIAALAVAFCHVSAVPTLSAGLLTKLRAGETVNLMIVLKSEVAPVVNSINSRHFTTSGQKTTALVAELRKFTSASQRPIIEFLQQNKAVGVHGYWITNRIFYPKASLELVKGVSTKFADEIAEIREQVVAHFDRTIEGPAAPRPQKVVEWGVEKIEADDVWPTGVTGEGLVISHIDTGVRATHQALAGAIRDTHAWFDPYYDDQEPNDQNGHGTHTMGTIVGRDGTGVAPGAKYITCRGCVSEGCTEEALYGCAEWTTCPTQPDGSDENCEMKPALSSNSWGGGSENAWYDDAINAWRAADIVPVFAIGNAGPGCRTANSPGDRPIALSVGATTKQDQVASFSSHGPSLWTSRIKPEVSAPGAAVRSASHEGDDLYVEFSGTSMATPHVAGAVALLLQKKPTLTIAEVTTLLESTTVHPRIESIICTGGGVNITNPWPNNSYGWGRISAKAAVDAAN